MSVGIHVRCLEVLRDLGFLFYRLTLGQVNGAGLDTVVIDDRLGGNFAALFHGEGFPGLIGGATPGPFLLLLPTVVQSRRIRPTLAPFKPGSVFLAFSYQMLDAFLDLKKLPFIFFHFPCESQISFNTLVLLCHYKRPGKLICNLVHF